MFPTKKREKYIFPSPTPSLQVLPLCESPVDKNKHTNFEWRGGVWIIVLFSKGTPSEGDFSTKLLPIVAIDMSFCKFFFT